MATYAESVCLAAALVLGPGLWAQGDCKALGPCYTAEGIVNSASGQAGALAPYTFATIYGTNLANAARGRNANDPLPGIGGVNVVVNGINAMVFYVSALQVNFLVPLEAGSGEWAVYVAREGQKGPNVKVKLSEVAPALFCSLLEPAWVVAQRLPDFSPATAQSPARPGEYVILYATGLGGYAMPVEDYEPPQTAIEMQRRREFQLLLDDVPVDDSRIEYAGSVVKYWGLFQINLKLPEGIGDNPEIRIAVGGEKSPPGLRLWVRSQ